MKVLDYKIKIGLVPERRFLPGPKRTGIFNPDYAVANKNKVIDYIEKNYTDENTQFCNIEFLNDEGLLFHIDQCKEIAEYFKQQEVDAVFLINCNFGNEEAAGKIAQMVGKPVLLWGPRDTIFCEDGTRYTDTQCGLFAISKQLKRNSVPFSYIENCNIEDKVFDDGFKRFLSVVCMVKNFYKLKIVQVGVRVKPFKSVMVNELELMEKFGIDIVPVNMAEATSKLNRIYSEKIDQLKIDAQEIKMKIDTSTICDELLVKMMAFVYFYKELDEENKAGIISTECWTSMQLAFGAMPCLAMSILADMGCLVICESDIYGAVTSALLSCACRGKTPPFFGEFTSRNPLNDNSELLWHCGPFAYSLKKEGVKANLYNARPSWQLADGWYTIARFQAERGKYYLLGGNIRTTEGPYTFGTYIWAEFDNLPKVERKLVEGPYIHHMSEAKGNYTDILREFCKYVPELIFDDIND
jgi:L-fucose isomerase and related proteins